MTSPLDTVKSLTVSLWHAPVFTHKCAYEGDRGKRDRERREAERQRHRETETGERESTHKHTHQSYDIYYTYCTVRNMAVSYRVLCTCYWIHWVSRRWSTIGLLTPALPKHKKNVSLYNDTVAVTLPGRRPLSSPLWSDRISGVFICSGRGDGCQPPLWHCTFGFLFTSGFSCSIIPVSLSFRFSEYFSIWQFNYLPLYLKDLNLSVDNFIHISKVSQSYPLSHHPHIPSWHLQHHPLLSLCYLFYFVAHYTKLALHVGKRTDSADLTLSRSYASNHSCREFMSTRTMSCPETSIS